MTQIRVLIVEDQSLIAEGLKALLKKYEIDVIKVCSTGEEAIEVARSVPPDLLLMDIHLAGALDGIATAKLINDFKKVPVIYLTDLSDSKTLERAKQTFPANYMTKPYNEADLVRAIDVAFFNANHSQEKKADHARISFIRTDAQTYLKLNRDEILYLEADRSYCVIMTLNGPRKLATSLNHVHEQLADQDFVRVHRSYVVNLKKIDAIDGNVLKIGKHEVQMSKDYRDQLLSRIDVIR